MRLQSLGFLSVVLLPALNAQATPSPIGRDVYVFGDSLSDNGNFAATFGELSPPYDPQRFSNSLIWTDYLAIALRTSIDPVLAGGSNYAFAGATAARDTYSFPGTSGIEQIEQLISSAGGQLDGKALYVVQIGVNDMGLDILFGAAAEDAGAAAAEATGAMVSLLVSTGAKDVIVMNMMDIADDPLMDVLEPDMPGITDAMRIGVNAYNAHVEDIAEMIDANIQIADAYGLFKYVTSHPSRFGLQNVTDACFGDVDVCPDPSRYLFSDLTHPTETGHKVIAAMMFFDIVRERSRHSDASDFAGIGMMVERIGH